MCAKGDACVSVPARWVWGMPPTPQGNSDHSTNYTFVSTQLHPLFGTLLAAYLLTT